MRTGRYDPVGLEIGFEKDPAWERHRELLPRAEDLDVKFFESDGEIL
jgi:hypothetical protein